MRDSLETQGRGKGFRQFKPLCEAMNIQRSSFYAWKKRLSNPCKRKRDLLRNIHLFVEYHKKYPSHGYRWLNAKIRMDTGTVLSNPYAHKCYKIAGIKSQAKHYKYKKPRDARRVYANLLLSELQIDRPLQCIVSDMTAFRVSGVYYELTLYMGLWNNEIVSLRFRRNEATGVVLGRKIIRNE